MYLIVGLGNPGAKYIKTYHNLGYKAIDKVAERLGVEFTKTRNSASIATTKYHGQTIILAKPLTYMNLSGESVAGFVRKQKIDPKNVIVFCDDIDLPKGTTRYREHGSGGTHNGLRNIVLHIGEGFKRIKIGAGSDNIKSLVDYVLSKIDNESMELILPAIDEAVNKLFEIIK